MINNQRDHEHDAVAPAAQPVVDVPRPGRAAVASALAGPAHPVASGLVVARAKRFEAERPERDEDGVAPGAEAAVEGAAAGSGHALPDALRDRFEATLGVDLGAVRVHTGPASAAAADAVNAHAYAVGNDIHFGAGAYDPASQAGQRLIAHEVVHTVQQAGGAAHAQFKLKVSTPGDAHELEADALADKMVAASPEPAPVSSGASGLARASISAAGRGVYRWARSERHGFRRFANVEWVKENPKCPWNGAAADYTAAPVAFAALAHPAVDRPAFRTEGFPEPLDGLNSKGETYGLPPWKTVEKANDAIDALELAGGAIVTAHDATAAHVRSYDAAASQVAEGQPLGPAPTGLNWDPPKEGAAASVGALAEQQTPHGGKTALGELYKDGKDVQGVGDKTLAAAKKEEVSKALEAARGKDQGVKDAVRAYGTHVDEGIGNAARAVANAFASLAITQEQGKIEDAETRKAELEREKADAMAIVNGAATVITKSAKLFTGDVETVAGGLVFVAEKVVSMSMENDLKVQVAAIERAKTKIKSLQADIVSRNVLSAITSLNARVGELATKRAAVQKALKDRQDAFDAAAKLAEKHGAAGGNKAEADRLRTAIAAIPRIETVLAKIKGVLAAAVLPRYDAQAGLAYAVGKKAGKGFDVGGLDTTVGLVKYHAARFEKDRELWQGRLDSANKIAGGLNVSGT